jgi:leader peptidase (prepilin peptidase)/N-methyltransferase
MTIASALVGAAFAGLMLAIAVSDWRRYRVPDRLTALALALRGIDLIVAPPGSPAQALMAGLARAAAMAAIFYAFRIAYRLLRGRDGLGLGDVKLAAVAGAWVDWPALPYVVEAAALFGLGLAFVRAARGGGPRAQMKLPFAVGFAPAIFVGWQMQNFGF